MKFGLKKILYSALAITALVLLVGIALVRYESFDSLYDAKYVGAEVCGECHTQIYPEWQRSPHANMTRLASDQTVVGNFADVGWFAPDSAQDPAGDTGSSLPAAKMYRDGERYIMALRNTGNDGYTEFPIERVVGYQYRQVYLTRENGGVLRRLPIQWSTERQDYFAYWNFQEHTSVTTPDLWDQMRPLNSAWNLYCARCHTTKLSIDHKNAGHTEANAHWVDDGIACEACHGPGSSHVNYMSGNPVNRIAAFLNSQARNQPVAYIANANKLEKGQAMSVCARCHGADIFRKTMDTYRNYEPGYSDEGRINDLSMHFRETTLTPRDGPPTLETWADARPKGVGMLFRSFIESDCYQQAEPRCYDCHNPHDNKQPAKPGLLAASDASNAYCLDCHQQVGADLPAHTHHAPDTSGSYCYDCHMPRHIMIAATGVTRYARTHTMSSIPNPASTLKFGQNYAPNACNDCHQKESAQWAIDQLMDWGNLKQIMNQTTHTGSQP